MQLSLRFLVVTTSLFFSRSASCQDTIARKTTRNIATVGSVSLIYAGTMSVLYNTWYRQYDQEPFHFFDDSKEWRGMDKLGHATTSWWTSQWLKETFEVAGYSEKSARLYGTIVPLAFLSTVEIFDGFSSGWGFSGTDMLANLAGSSLFFTQDLLFSGQKALLRYSYHSTPLRKIRPELLGENQFAAALKDYNGQTYWLSLPLKPLFGNEKQFPEFLCISIGYGAGGMLGGDDNIWFQDNKQFDYTA